MERTLGTELFTMPNQPISSPFCASHSSWCSPATAARLVVRIDDDSTVFFGILSFRESDEVFHDGGKAVVVARVADSLVFPAPVLLEIQEVGDLVRDDRCMEDIRILKRRDEIEPDEYRVRLPDVGADETPFDPNRSVREILSELDFREQLVRAPEQYGLRLGNFCGDGLVRTPREHAPECRMVHTHLFLIDDLERQIRSIRFD